ncbi:MAG: amidohydrolase family protein, partial [Victivallales bacterium]|nr:amidohydrolase family protein [Victivallales bacterium]
ASVLGLSAGTLSLGAPADVTLLDLAVRRPLEVSRFHSRSRNCPYDGLVCRGRVVQVFVDGIARL